MAEETESVPPREQIESQLYRMLNSERFIANENPARFLKLVVEKAVKGDPVTQSIIGCELFPTKYAQNDISDVRVTASNLRAVLAKYYAHEGRYDLIVIALPKPPARNAPKLPAGKAYKPLFSYNPRSPAHQEYSRGLAMLSQLRLDLAEGHFIAAIDSQPKYPEPYLALATTYLLFPICVNQVFVDVLKQPAVDSQTWLPAARKLLATALKIDRKSRRAHVLRGVVHCYQHRWKKANLAFDTALQISLEKTRSDGWYVAYLATLGKLDEAAAILKARLADASDDPALLTEYGFLMYVMRRFNEAYDAFTDASRIDKRYWPAWIGHALLLQEKELSKAWVDSVNRQESGLIIEALHTYFPGLSVLFTSRWSGIEEARKTFESFNGTHNMDALQVALAWMGLGKIEEATTWLHDAFLECNPVVLWLHLWPIFDSVRKHEAFQGVIQKMNLPSSTWRERLTEDPQAK